jgi:cellulose synthase/poly-beta-1,6-N-acetylglucosamine synthase-like glycosyltransferase
MEAPRGALRLAALSLVLGVVFTLVTYALARRRRRHDPAPEPRSWPFVTVQLPIRNEFYVADRVIAAAAALAYPRDRFEVQVLDDSDDETIEVVDAAVAVARAAGVDIRVLRRGSRAGYKAGHLALGLESARGEFVAMFDADFVPPPDFLARTVPLFAADPKLGMAQARWTFLNRDASLLTRAQAMILDALLVIEQPSKSARAWPFQFNGTAGVWRRASIDDAGGWSGDSVAEDLDLSYRAYLRGWRFVHLADLEVPTELPVTVAAFRAQQERWTRGNAQVLRKLGLRILASDMPLGHRLGMLLHLGGRAVYALVAILALTLPWTSSGVLVPLVAYPPALDVALFAAAVVSVGALHAAAQRAIGRSALRAVVALPTVFALSFGISLLCGIAYVHGLCVRRGEFVRTPKRGDRGEMNGPRYGTEPPPLALVELVVAALSIAASPVAAARGELADAALLAAFGGSFAWVAAASLLGTLTVRRSTRQMSRWTPGRVKTSANSSVS